MAALMEIDGRGRKRRAKGQLGMSMKRQRRFGVRPFFPGIRRRLLFGARRGARSVALRNLRTGGLLGIELKYFDVPRTLNAIVAPADASGGEQQPSSICTGCISAPAQGDGAQNREGHKIVIKSCLISGAVVLNGVAGLAVLSAQHIPSVYVALVLDTQTNGVTINSEDVFANPSGTAMTNTKPFRNMSYTTRFKVLATRTFTPAEFFFLASNDAAATTISTNDVNVPFTLSWKGQLPVQFTVGSTTADVANVIDNSLHVVAFTTATALTPQLAFQSRIRFVG